jgi:hypothetical protein
VPAGWQRAWRAFCIVTGLTVMAAASHTFVLGGIVSGSELVPLQLHRLQSTLLTGVPIVWAAATVACFLIVTLLPRAAAVVDGALPCGRVPVHAKRRFSDADAAQLQARGHRPANARNGMRADSDACAPTNWEEMADNIHIGVLAVAWHITMAGAIVALGFDKQLTTAGGRARFTAVAVALAVGLLLAAVWEGRRSVAARGPVSGLRLVLRPLAWHTAAASVLLGAFLAGGGHPTLWPFTF